MPEPRLRQAVRALVLSPDDRVLLLRFTYPETTLWGTPGGGIHPGEQLTEALRRELHEEVGHVDAHIGAPIWRRRALFPVGGYDGQDETYFLVRAVDARPRQSLFSADQLRSEHVTGSAWWTVDEMLAAGDTFAPRHLPRLVGDLLAAGPPVAPIDISAE